MIKRLDKNRVEKYIADGLIIRQWHPTLPLQILNYSRDCEYQSAWDDYTMNLRGAVYDKDYNLICPGLTKFFNFYQHTTAKQKDIVKRMDSEKFIVQTKWDGCYGAIFVYDGHLVCASKGSFDSFVTKEMYKMIEGKLFANDLETLNSNLIVEVISPETHILCNYGKARELRVITSFKCYGDYEEWSLEQMHEIIKTLDPKQELLKPIETYNMTFDQLIEWQKQHNETLTEGFVVKILDGKQPERIKFKSDEYLALAASKSYCDPIHLCNAVLDLLNTKENELKYRDRKWVEKMHKLGENLKIQDEIYDEYMKLVSQLELKVEFIFDKFFSMAQKYKDLDNRELGLKAKTDPELKANLGVIFNIRNDKPLERFLVEKAKQEWKEWLELPEEERERLTQERQEKIKKHDQAIKQWRNENNES